LAFIEFALLTAVAYRAVSLCLLALSKPVGPIKSTLHAPSVAGSASGYLHPS